MPDAALRLRGRLCEQQGFTLLELLVGVVLLSLLVVTMYSGFRLGARSWESGEAKSETATRMRLVSGFIRRHLSEARVVVTRKANRAQPAFEGSRTEMRFVGEMPSHLGLGGPYSIRIHTLEDRGSQLAVSLSPHDPESGPAPDAPAHESVLIDDLLEARFSYFGVPRRGADRRWYEQWSDARNLPTLIRLELESESAGQWPELVVRLYVNGLARGRGRAVVPVVRLN